MGRRPFHTAWRAGDAVYRCQAKRVGFGEEVTDDKVSNTVNVSMDVDSSKEASKTVVVEPQRITMGQDFIKLTLSFHHRQMLRFAAERGGRFQYTFGMVAIQSTTLTEAEKKKMADDANASIREMAEKLNLFKMTKLIGPSYQAESYEFELTDIGRNVIEQMGIVVKPQELRINMKTGKEIIG